MTVNNPSSQRRRILELTATTIRADRTAYEILQGNNNYLNVLITELKQRGHLVVTKNNGWVARITMTGVQWVGKKKPKMIDFFMNYSSNNRPGGTKAHVEAQCKASEVVAMMMRADVTVGAEKPSREEIINGHERNHLDNAVFYLSKEFKVEAAQKVSRAQISRATGFLFSNGINALVYNSQSDVMNVNRTAEKTTNFQTVVFRNEVVDAAPIRTIARSIVMGDDYEIAKRLMTEQRIEKKASKIKKISDCIADRDITGTDFLFVPLNEFGTRQLKLLTMYPQEEILQLLFSDDELNAASKSGECEAIIGELKCFEFITMNLSKLFRVLSIYKNNLSKIGFVCAESQVDFIKGVYPGKQINIRAIKDSVIEQLTNESY